MILKDYDKIRNFSDGNGILSYLNKSVKTELNREGFYTEKIDDSSLEVSESHLKVISNFREDFSEINIGKELFSNNEAIKYNSKLGYYTNLYAGYVKDEVQRIKSSSGGLTTWLLCKLKEEKRIDYVISVGKGNDDKLFQYTISETVDQIKETSKTKYYPVELSKVLEFVKNTEGKFAVVGIPSFITSLRLLAREDEEINSKIIFHIGLVCGHIKSTKFTEYMCKQMGVSMEDVIDVNYRDKNNTFKSDNYNITVKYNENGKILTKTKSIKNLDGQDWGKGYFKHYSSDFVRDVMNETADVTFGDAWLPEFTNDPLGTNIVLIRNKTIEKIFRKGFKESDIYLQELTEKKIIQSQIAHFRHTQDELSYRIKINKLDSDPLFKNKIEYNSISIDRKIVQHIRKKITSKSTSLYIDNQDLDVFYSKMKKYNVLYKYTYLVSRVFRKILRK